jgi:hypothetical protein
MLERLAPVGSLDDGQAVGLEVDAADRPDRALVVDEKNPRRGLGRLAATGSAAGIGRWWTRLRQSPRTTRCVGRRAAQGGNA